MIDKNGVEMKEGDIIHVSKDRFGTGRDEVWSVEWNEDLGKYYAYNQLNSDRDFEMDICDYEGRLHVRVTDTYIFVCEVSGNLRTEDDVQKEPIKELWAWWTDKGPRDISTKKPTIPAAAFGTWVHMVAAPKDIPT